jgi:hypothetical protein
MYSAHLCPNLGSLSTRDGQICFSLGKLALRQHEFSLQRVDIELAELLPSFYAISDLDEQRFQGAGNACGHVAALERNQMADNGHGLGNRDLAHALYANQRGSLSRCRSADKKQAQDGDDGCQFGSISGVEFHEG